MTKIPDDSLRESTAEEFISRLQAIVARPDAAFAFFLGAGCSLSCQIPGTGDLVRQWLKKLYRHTANKTKHMSFSDWSRSYLQGCDAENPGSSYGQVIQDLFPTSEERQLEIDMLCSGKLPKFGYAVLAALMSIQGKYRGRFNVVLTTNFDDLLQDALIHFNRPKPLVIHHDALAEYIRPTRTRPLILKLHGDHSLSPKNTREETTQLQKLLQDRVRGVLHDRGLIFIGYGGNDQSILELLEGLPDVALPLGVYWVSGSLPRGVIFPWLKKRNAVWVKYPDFDLLMEKILRTFSKAIRSGLTDQRMITDFLNLYERMDDAQRTHYCGKAIGQVLKSTDPVFFQRLATYADFLQDDYVRDYKTADFYYQAITKENPQNAEVLGNYADFLERRMSDSVRAKEFYEKAIEADSKGFRNLGNYAGFLEQQKKFDPAKVYYVRAARAVNPAKFPEDAAGFWFKAYTLDVSDDRSVALGHLKTLIQNGVKLPPKFHPDTQWATDNAHPGNAWLDRLVDVLNGTLKQSALKKWNEWNNA